MAPPAELLTPIAGANRSGADLRYDAVYDKIKEARREDDDAPQGEWARTRKLADWPLVAKLATEAIAKRSKDLQLGAWLTEAWLRRDGFAGLTNGLELLHGLLDQFWETLYPELDEGDAEPRAAPLAWVGSRLDLAVLLVPIAKGTFGLIAYRESRAVGYENPQAESAAVELRKEQIEQGKVTGEMFDAAFAATPKAFYKDGARDTAAALLALQALDDAGRARFGSDAPGYGTLRTAIEDVQRVIAQLLAKKLELDPDPPEEVAAAAAVSAAANPVPATVAGGISAEPTDRADAAARAVAAARFLRRASPTDPTSYLILRAVRWGELRASGSPPDPRVLDAPPGASRMQLRSLLLDGKWPELLEAAETLMGSPAGRGWLDLQRYALTACEALGADYERVASALRDELRLVLAAVPTLPEMSLMDDLPTANPETRAWLAQFTADATAAAVESGAAASASRASSAASNGDGRDKVFERASSEARAGNAQKAMELLKRELEREQSRRGRWMRQGQLASIMVDHGLSQVAAPILEELVLSIETHRLEEWEASEVVAQPLTLLYRCLEKLEGDAARRQELYLRICRLDPMAAIGFGQQ